MSEQKSPEQIAAELKQQAEIKAAQDKAAAEKAQKDAEEKLAEKKAAAGDVHFVYNGEVFKPIMPRVNIPGIGRRTALEICADEEAQEYLITNGCIGTVIEQL